MDERGGGHYGRCLCAGDTPSRNRVYTRNVPRKRLHLIEDLFPLGRVLRHIPFTCYLAAAAPAFLPPLRSAGTGGSSGSAAIFRYSSRT